MKWINPNRILEFLDDAETIGAEVASKLAPWLAPLLSAVVVAQAVTGPPFKWEQWQANLLGVIVELMGLATLSTAMMLFSYRQRQPVDNKPSLVPLWLATGGVVVYMMTVAAITVALKIPAMEEHADWISPLVFVGILMLSVAAHVSLTVRRDHYRLLNPPKSAQTGRRRRPLNKPPASQSNNERLANLDRANTIRQPTPADYDYAARLRADGHTWSEVADKIGRSVSTAKKWAEQSNGQPVNGRVP